MRHGSLKYIILVVFIRTVDMVVELQQRLRETRSVTHTTPVQTGRPRTVRTGVNESAIIAALERQPCRIVRYNTKELDPQPLSVAEVFLDEHLDPCHFLWKVHLFPEDRPMHLFYV